MDCRDSYHVTCFLYGLRYAKIELSFLYMVRAERIWEWELTSLELRSSKGTVVWTEEVSEDLVCDIKYAMVTVILRV
jgi:hypothetical protein